MFNKTQIEEPKEIFQSSIKFERKSSIKRFEIEIKINILYNKLNEEIESKFPYSQSISFRLNPTSSSSLSKNIISSKQDSNSKLIEKINQFQPKLHVDLSYSSLIDEDMKIIADKVIQEKKCTELWLYGNQITSKGVEILALSLKNNSTLKYLDLSYNQISNLGVRTICEVLLSNQNSSSLKTLYLSKNMISDDGVKYLSDMLRTNETLTELWLSSNEIGYKGVQQLINVLTYHNKTLKCLSLSMNIFLTDLCINDLIEMFKHNQTLKKLWLTDCNLTEQGKAKLYEIAKQKKNFRIEL